MATAAATLLAVVSVSAQDQPRGRKYKAPPETSHIQVLVTKKSNGKPIQNAAVVFHPYKDGKDAGNLEVKTDPEGKATVDIIPVGSTVRVQVIASGFATFADDYSIDGSSKEIAVTMLRPREQISAYEDNSGKAATRKPGVQEPVKPDTQKQPATPPKPTPPPPTDAPAPSTTTAPQL